MAYGSHAIAHHDAHGRVENFLATLLTALSAGLAALVLNTFSDSRGDARCTF
ncbi:putative two-component system sensor kinase [Pseudomonas sp. St290]|nr:putative two-component system sensor kinase [Pseudomonas sp. St290]